MVSLLRVAESGRLPVRPVLVCKVIGEDKIMKMIVGLGNIGRQYAQTRHNVGFMIVDELASKLNVTFKRVNLKHRWQRLFKTVRRFYW